MRHLSRALSASRQTCARHWRASYSIMTRTKAATSAALYMPYYAPTSNPVVLADWTNYAASTRVMQLLPCAIVALATYPVVTLVAHTIEHRMRAKHRPPHEFRHTLKEHDSVALPEYNAPEEDEIPKNAKVYLILSRGLEKNNGTRTSAP
uniref:Uncharacterized protein n=1 Tax=Oryza sativa subsp. japonica TaxID=39947 RepID=Q2QVE9_ORYSJ|nr:hypothetical protein LOC_Os12g13050 [Oryza sativa Japonica Group]